MGILEINDLTIRFKTRRGMVNVVRGVDIQVEKGELLGIAGESGCGKTTTALSIPRLLPANAHRIRLYTHHTSKKCKREANSKQKPGISLYRGH